MASQASLGSSQGQFAVPVSKHRRTGLLLRRASGWTWLPQRFSCNVSGLYFARSIPCTLGPTHHALPRAQPGANRPEPAVHAPPLAGCPRRPQSPGRRRRTWRFFDADWRTGPRCKAQAAGWPILAYRIRSIEIEHTAASAKQRETATARGSCTFTGVGLATSKLCRACSLRAINRFL
jgi:hypothetical protein